MRTKGRATQRVDSLFCFVFVIFEPKGGDAICVTLGLEKASWLCREYAPSIVVDPVTARTLRKRLGENGLSRPPIIVREARRQHHFLYKFDRSNCSTLSDEVPR